MKNLFYIEECSSTNDEIVNHIPADLKNCSAIYTFHQKNGRGQYGNHWQSSVAENLAISFAIPITYFLVSHHLLNYHTAILIREFLAKLADEIVLIKWPNDFILKDKKMGGMIIEITKVIGKDYYIIGVGVNVLQEKFDGLQHAGSIYTLTNQKLDLHTVAQSFFHYFLEHFHKLFCEDTIMETYNSYLFNKNKIRVYSINHILQNGIISHADKNGYLWVDLEKDGLRKFFHKEIEMLY